MAPDFVLPFQLESIPVRGRFVRLKGSLQNILKGHQYPPVINRLLAELTVLAAALASLFKVEGIFTLQVNGDGPIRLMVADVTHKGEMRAYAQFNQQEVLALPAETAFLPSLFGLGYLAFTIDPINNEERYQGVVELKGANLSECIHHFFRQSDQLDTGIAFFSDVEGGQNLRYAAAALIIQRMPPAPPPAEKNSVPFKDSAPDLEDAWLQSLSLIGTATAAEMLSEDLPAQDLLYRLFWQNGIRVFEQRFLLAKCRCSKERIENLLKTFSQSDIKEMIKEEVIHVTCEFCSKTYKFDPKIFP